MFLLLHRKCRKDLEGHRDWQAGCCALILHVGASGFTEKNCFQISHKHAWKKVLLCRLVRFTRNAPGPWLRSLLLNSRSWLTSFEKNAPENVYRLFDNARPHVAQMSRQKTQELGWEIMPHSEYSTDLAQSDYHLQNTEALPARNGIWWSRSVRNGHIQILQCTVPGILPERNPIITDNRF